MSEEMPRFPANFRWRMHSISDDGLSIQLFACLNDISECDAWIAEYSRLNPSRWIVKESHPNGIKIVCSKHYRCHHSAVNKTTHPITGRKSKNFNCMASIAIFVKITNYYTRRNHAHIKENLPAVIKMNLKHSHDTDSAEALEYLAPTAMLKSRFYKIFSENKMGVAKAIQEHRRMRQKSGLTEISLRNASMNPKLSTVKHWYRTWLKEKLDSHALAETIEQLEKRVIDYQKIGVYIKICQEPFSVIVVTPFMKRVANLLSNDILFIDSTSSCDVNHHSVTFVFTKSVAGAVPLAVLITKGQNTLDYISAFYLLKEALDTRADPRFIMTDDSNAELTALQQVFPDSRLLLCHFHIAQSIWRWLCDVNKHCDSKDDRQHMFRLFKNILISSTSCEAEEAYSILKTDELSLKYSNWMDYVEKYWERKEDWCHAFRDAYTHDYQTNNYADITDRIFKDKILQMFKAYDVVELIDYIVSDMEEHYIDRCEQFAYGNNEANERLWVSLLKEAAYLTKDKIIQINNSNYIVPSSDKTDQLYDVDMLLGCCSCDLGYLGKPCKHQFGVCLLFFDELEIKNDDYYAMAILALGDAANGRDHYKPFCEKNEEPSTSKSNKQVGRTEVVRQELSQFKNNIALEDVEDDTNVDSETLCESFNATVSQFLNSKESSYFINKFNTSINNIKNTSDMCMAIERFCAKPKNISHRNKINVGSTVKVSSRGNVRQPLGNPLMSVDSTTNPRLTIKKKTIIIRRRINAKNVPIASTP